MEIGIDYIGITTPFYCHDGQGYFLLHERSENTRDEHYHWDPGSGKLEFGVEPAANVLKEVGEEYGCSGVVQDQIPAHSIYRMWNGRKTHWLAIPFFVLVDPTQVKNNEPHKIKRLGWFKLGNLPQPLHTGFQFTLENYGSYFDKYR